MHRFATTLAVLTAATTVFAGCSPPNAATIAALGATPCTEHSVPVHLSATDTTTYHIVGWLCPGRDPTRATTTVQLLVSGLTYGHSYWDTEYQPDRYSYVRAANAYGYTTFNIDRLGIGRSDHPPADMLTLQTHAYALGQVITELRSGTVSGKPFPNVVGVGHSMGAGILQYLAATAHDRAHMPDHLVLIGYLSKTNPAVVAQIGTDLYPAQGDPSLQQTQPPAGYLTTRPGTRRDLFFATGDTDPAVLALDEALKQTSTLAERSTVAAARDKTITHAVPIPVLLVVGQHDHLACDESAGLSCATPVAIIARESANFSTQTCLSAYVLPGAGHATNLHRNAHLVYDHTNQWVDRYLSNGGLAKDNNGCPI